MKFYKIHSSKFKDSDVLMIPENFDVIGPDAFQQTEFEIIVLSHKVKTISDYAFSNIKNCKVYIPPNVKTIESLAFENLSYGNEFYCVKDSEAYKVCTTSGLTVNENPSEILGIAEEKWQAYQERTKKKLKENAAQPVEKKTEKTAEQPVKKQETENIPKKETYDPEDLETRFAEIYGLPPEITEFSEYKTQWEEKLQLMDTNDIVTDYDDDDFCEEYKYLCYAELRRRFALPEIDDKAIKKEPQPETVKVAASDAQDVQDQDFDPIAHLGVPPECTVDEEERKLWLDELELLPTKELLERYDSPNEWREEYRCVCYELLIKRGDLKIAINRSAGG